MTVFTLADAEAVKLITTLLIFGIVVAVNVVSAIKKNADARRRKVKPRPGATDGGLRTAPPKRVGQEIEDFLRSLGQQPSKPKPQPQRSQPRAPQAPRPEPKKPPVRRPEPLVASRSRPEKPHRAAVETKSRAAARPEVSKHYRQATPAPKRAKPEQGGMEDAQRTVATAKDVVVEAVTPAEALDAKLPKPALKRAVMLREILGPCRAKQPYSPQGR